MIRFALIVASTLGFLLTAALGNLIVPLLRAFRLEQDAKIRQEERERQSKPEQESEPEPEKQIPTMGGLCLMVGTLAAVGVGWTAACVAQPELLGNEGLLTTRLLIGLLSGLLFGAVGLSDDVARLRRHSPLGLRRTTRLALEAGAAAVVQVLLAANHCLASGLTLPILGYCELGGFAPILWEVLLVVLAECARVTDGVDGVLCGTAFAAMLGLMVSMTLLGWFPLAVLPAALAGALMAFLLWNFHPAKLLPGAVGSLFLAGVLGGVPLSIGWPGLSLPLSLPYWIEGGMIALQVVVYQGSGGKKQLFRIAPLHRWLEKRGYAPVTIFYLFAVIALMGFALTVRMAKIS